MEELLNTTQSHAPLAWLQDIQRKDPDTRCIVTEVSHYKQRSSWPVLQLEYLTLLTLLTHPPDQSQPALPPVLLKVSRDPLSRDNPSRYRLCGATDDRVTVLGPATDIQLFDEQLHRLTWPIDRAPHLEDMSCFIACVHYDIPQKCLFLEQCCHAFARAILQAYHNAFHGIPGTSATQMLIPSLHLVHTIPPGMPFAERVAKILTTHDAIFYNEEDALEERLERFGPDDWMLGGSCLAYMFPVRTTDVRHVAHSVARAYHGPRGDARRAALLQRDQHHDQESS